jgi:hypothetical protein
MTDFRRIPLLSLALVTLSLATACADVGSGSGAKPAFPVVKSTDHDVIVCQSIRTSIQTEAKAVEQARAAGNAKEAARHLTAMQTGVESTTTVKNCDISDLTLPSGAATPAAVPTPS